MHISAEAGVWYDFEAGKGGITALSLIAYLLEGASFPVLWAQQFLHSHKGEASLSSHPQNGTRQEADSATAHSKVGGCFPSLPTP